MDAVAEDDLPHDVRKYDAPDRSGDPEFGQGAVEPVEMPNAVHDKATRYLADLVETISGLVAAALDINRGTQNREHSAH